MWSVNLASQVRAPGRRESQVSPGLSVGHRLEVPHVIWLM